MRNDFFDKFQTYSNSELIKIIDSSSDYQPLAVEAAQNIIESRQLSDHEMANAKAELELQRQEKETQVEKKKILENKVKDLGASVIDTINPIEQIEPTADRLIKLVTIVFAGLSIYQIFKGFGMFQFMFSYSGGQWDFSMLLYFLPLIIVPIATYFFWKRKKFGWILLAIFFTFSAVNAIAIFILTFNIQPSGILVLDNLHSSTSSTTHILTFLFFGGTLWVICKDIIREQYNINHKAMFTIIGITTSIIGLIAFSLF